MRVRIEEQKDGEFRVEFVGDNGEPWYQSTEGYTSRSNAIRSLDDFTDAMRLPENIPVYHFNADGEQMHYG